MNTATSPPIRPVPAAPTPAPAAEPVAGSPGGLVAAGRDTVVLAWRNYMHHVRVPSLVVFSLMTPAIFLLLFRYILGGSIVVPGIAYVDYLVPGVLVLSIAFGATQTGVGIGTDVGRGITDRFRSLPISRLAVVGGRVVIDAGRNLLVSLVIVVGGLLMGFRPDGSLLGITVAVLLAVMFGYAFSWIAAYVGVTVKHAEAVHDAGFVWVIPLTFMSSALVEVDSMPTGVRWLAEANPMTSVTDAVRALMLGDPAGGALLRSGAWIVAILAVFVPLTLRAYERR